MKMLNQKNAVATIAVKSLRSSRQFYEDQLGFKPIETDDQNYISYQSGNHNFLVYQSQFAGGYKATVITWNVDKDIDEIVQALKDKGVSFEHYDMPGTKRQGDIHVMGNMKNAWFKDPDGNIISLVST